MIYLLISILLNAYLGIAFVAFNKFKVDIFQSIVFNYWVCVITGSFMLGSFPIHAESLQTDWFKMAIIMGFLFISVFNLIGISSVKVGATITQTATKLSLAIPVIFSYYLYNETISTLKIIGIIIALIAVVLTTLKPSTDVKTKIPIWEFALPLILFFSSGIIDTLTTFVNIKIIKNDDAISNSYLIAGFMVAAILGTLALIYLYITGKKKFEFKNLLAGIILGIPNYFSIYFLIKALQSKSLNSSATIPINNIGVLFIVSICGIFIFKEKLSKLNYLGIILSLIAILCIYFGDVN